MMKDKDIYFFLGIGGIGMSALAQHLLRHGQHVLGYDRRPSGITEKLESLGAEISFAKQPDMELPPKTKVVYTPAIQQEDPWFQFAKNCDPAMRKRSELLQEVCNEMQCLAVAGTHGKTTTSAILCHLLTELGAAPTAFLGGVLKGADSNYLAGQDRLCVVEADEYDRSFLKLHPQHAIITSVEADHLDVYGSERDYVQAFIDFRRQVEGHCFIERHLTLKGTTYGFTHAEHAVQNLRISEMAYHFDWVGPGFQQTVKLPYPGKHNVLNALGAAALCSEMGYAIADIATALSSFPGVKRRFELLYHSQRHVYYDDYAHHPGELAVLIESLREWHPDKPLTMIFQPHLFSRTRDHMTEFAEVLNRVDHLILMPIYPAREKPISGISSEVLLEKATCEKKQIAEGAALLDLLERLQPELLVTAGAGDIDRLVPDIQKCASTW